MSQRIAVLYGGSSAERNVSLESGETVATALAERGHEIQLIDPLDTAVTEVNWTGFDCAFIALHGTYGEDGTVQRELDVLGVPYTGSGVEASIAAFHKWAAKRQFREAGVPTPVAQLVTDTAGVRTAAGEIGYPLVVKPCSQGSSVGVSIVQEQGDLAAASEECFRHDTQALVETAIVGEEWTVGLIGQLCLPPIRITPACGFYDYKAKYQDDRTDYCVAGKEAPAAFVDELQTLARRACDSLSTKGIARVDFRVDESGQPWVLEVNTVPGFTSHSLIPKAAAAVGMSLGELFESVLPVKRAQRLAG